MFKRLLAWLFRRAPEPTLQLHVNEAAAPQRERIHMDYRVNSADIRRGVMHNGRPHTVIPSYTLPDGVVMNGLLYTHAEIEASYKGLEGTLAPLSHPVVDGTYVSANTPEAINAHHIGAFNRNVERRGNRIYAEKWLDEGYAANTEGGKKLLEALDKGEPIHTSTGIFLSVDLTTNGKTADGTPYRGAARNMVMDHDAILIGETGAATPDQGVGLMVNTVRVEDAKPLQTNDVLSKLSYGNLQKLLSDAATAKWGGEDKWAWVQDFDSTTAIVRLESGPMAVDYAIKDGRVQWADAEKPVQEKTEWVDRLPIVNRILQSFGLGVNSGPDSTKTLEGNPDMAIERKELDEALAANQTATLKAVGDLLAPLTKGLTDLQTNHQALSDTLTANARAAEADKRKVVAEKLGQTVADALTGNALDEAHAKLVGAAPIVGGFATNGDDSGFKQTELPE